MCNPSFSYLIFSGLLALSLLSPLRAGAASVNLFVSGTFTYPDTSVKGFDGVTGDPFPPDGTFASGGGLSFPRGLAFGPDGNLYVASEGTDNILKYDGTTGTYLSEFVAAGAGGFAQPKGLAFAPDGRLYVAGYDTSSALAEVYRFDAVSGAFVDKVSDYWVLPSPFVFGIPYGVTTGPDGNVYFANESSSNVLRFNTAASSLSEFVSPASIGTVTPHYITFGPDGNLYVGIYDVPGRVLKFDGTTGAFIDTFVATGSGGLSRPEGLAFGPDGYLYVSSDSGVLRYSGIDGHFIDTFASLPYPLPFGPGGLAFHGVPEPATWIVATIGLAVVLMAGGRRRKRHVEEIQRSRPLRMRLANVKVIAFQWGLRTSGKPPSDDSRCRCQKLVPLTGPVSSLGTTALLSE